MWCDICKRESMAIGVHTACPETQDPRAIGARDFAGLREARHFVYDRSFRLDENGGGLLFRCRICNLYFKSGDEVLYVCISNDTRGISPETWRDIWRRTTS